VIAPYALKRARVEVQTSRIMRESIIGPRTFGTFDCDWRNAGTLRLGFRYAASLKTGGSAKLSVTGKSRYGAVMELVCSSGFRRHRSILLTFNKINDWQTWVL
jgi:hypothetical protein